MTHKHSLTLRIDARLVSPISLTPGRRPLPQPSPHILVSPGFGPISAQDASRNAAILSVSCRSMTNFAKMSPVAEFRRNSGRRWRRALATTSSEGGDAGPDGAQPGAEGVPDALREGDGEVLKQSLTDDRRLDEDVIGVQLAPDGVAVFGRRAMEVLVAAAAAQRLHVGHPEVVAERAEQPHRLLERVFDFEALAVDGTVGLLAALGV